MTYPTKLALALALTLLLPLGACDLDALPTSDRAALGTDDADARPDHRRPGPPPPLVLLELAVELGGLQDDATMTEALDAMEAAHTDALAARDDLREALAEAVAAETVTAQAVATQLAAITDAASIEGDALTSALDTAHGLLDADLRAEVVEALPEPPGRPEAGQGPPSGGKRPGGPSSGDRPSGQGEQQPPPEGEPGGHGPMELLEALDLDEDQQQALRDALGEPSRPERPEPLDLALFAEDDFDAASLGLAELHADHVTEQATRHVELLAALVPLLDDEQRATLEGLLREAPKGPTRSARG
jgi:LTXXQ motif family protein